MRFRHFQVDAFADRPFAGNPAAVAPMERWVDDRLLQCLAAEHNLSETAFFVPSAEDGRDFDLRWMTPTAEVRLCGHATVAAAHVRWNELGFAGEAIRFGSASGARVVTRDGAGRIVLDFPAIETVPVAVGDALVERVSAALGARPSEVHTSYDLVCVFESEAEVASLEPDFAGLAGVPDVRAIGCTAAGDGVDFVARLFAPAVGIDEDPVTGSLYTMLGPYWARRLGKDAMTARQISTRGGDLWIGVSADRPGRVRIAGHAVTYSRGEIMLPDEVERDRAVARMTTRLV